MRLSGQDGTLEIWNEQIRGAAECEGTGEKKREKVIGGGGRGEPG
jgi:hypothetical protein